MPALDPAPAGAAVADVDVELAMDRSAGDLDLVLVIDVGLVDPAAAVGASFRQGRFVNFVNLFGRGREAMGLAAIVGAGFTAGLLGFGLRWPLGEGGGLPLAGPLLLFEQTGQPLYVGFQFGDAPSERLATGTDRFIQVCMVAKRRGCSCARGEESGGPEALSKYLRCRDFCGHSDCFG
jgi:hypothetical protein